MHDAHYEFQFIAGNLALDFVNTVSYRGDAARTQERLEHAEDVRRWAHRAREARFVDRGALESVPRVAAAALPHIRHLREHLFAVFHAIATGVPIPPDILARVGAALHDCSARRRLSTHGEEVRWSWRPNARSTDRLLYPVLTAAIDLLTSDARPMVRECQGTGCGWLFVDRSNAGRRRWCSMADCGNRNKAHNYYERTMAR